MKVEDCEGRKRPALGEIMLQKQKTQPNGWGALFYSTNSTTAALLLSIGKFL
jgi:hypothetical protein